MVYYRSFLLFFAQGHKKFFKILCLILFFLRWQSQYQYFSIFGFASKINEMKKSLLPLFFFLSILNLIGEYLHHTPLIYATKPLLLTLLALFFFSESKALPLPFRWYLLAGLIFSIAGDTFLMFVENSNNFEHFFLFGLGSFLLTHLCYLKGFISLSNSGAWLRQRPWLLLLFFFYLVGNCIFLWPDLPDDLKIPVLVYSTAIIAMTAGALNLKGLLPNASFALLMSGILLFVCSDSIIALNKFKSSQLSLPLPRLLIMIPYLIGQYLIVMGSLKISSSNPSNV